MNARKSAEWSQTHKKIPIFAFPGSLQTEFPDVYLVIKVYKLLKQTGTDKEHKIYLKPDASKKELDQLKLLMPELLESHKNHPALVPFLWTAVSIFDEKGHLRGAFANPLRSGKDPALHVTNPTGQTVVMASPLGPEDNFSKKPTGTRRFDADLRLIKPGVVFSFETIYEALESETHLKVRKFRFVLTFCRDSKLFLENYLLIYEG
jgi:hypothetical protein